MMMTTPKENENIIKYEYVPQKKCDHAWRNILDVTSPTPKNEISIDLCDECQCVRVHYKDVNKKRSVTRPSSTR